MTLNLRARNIQLLIGGQDWSQQYRSIELQVPRRQPTQGYLPVTGTIELIEAGTLPSGLNSLDNDLWQAGTAISLQIADSTGVLWPWPFGTLQILEPPQPPAVFPGPGQVRSISVRIGCELAAADYDEPDGDESAAINGSARDRTVIINQLLSYLSAPGLVDAIPDYPINHRLPKQGGGYLQQAGQLAYGGLVCLWQDSAGDVRTLPLERVVATSLPGIDIERVVGESELEFEYHMGPIVPSDNVRAVGQHLSVQPATLNTKTKATRYGVATEVDPDAAPTIIRLQYLEEQERVSGSTRTIRRAVQEPRGLVVPDAVFEALGLISLDSPFALVPSLSEVEVWRYEVGGGKRLVSVEVARDERYGKALAAWIAANLPAAPALLQSIPSASEQTNIAYNQQDQTISRDFLAYGPLGEVAPEADYNGAIPSQLVPVDSLAETWKELRSREWQYQADGKLPLAEVSPDAVQAIANPLNWATLVADASRSTNKISNAGHSQPPAPDRAPEPWEEIEEFIEAEALFALGYGDARPYTFEVPIPHSEEQLQRLASIEAWEQFAARYGAEFTTDIPDEVLQGGLDPQFVISFDLDGARRLYRANGLVFRFGQTQAVMSGLGDYLGSIPLGTEPQGTPAPTLPTAPVSKPRQQMQILAGALVLSGEVFNPPYPLAVPGIALEGALVLSGEVLPVVSGALVLSGEVEDFLAGTLVLSGEVEIPDLYGVSIQSWAGTAVDGRSIPTVFAPQAMLGTRYDVADTRRVFDSVRGLPLAVRPDADVVEFSASGDIVSFGSNEAVVNAGLNTGNVLGLFFSQGSGFAIRAYSGDVSPQNISHSLQAVPDVAMVLDRGGGQNWAVYASVLSTPEDKVLTLDRDLVPATDITVWDSTPFTSSQIRVGTSARVNASGRNYIAYLFKAIPGLSAVGTYNGNSDPIGPVVNAGVGDSGDGKAVTVVLKCISHAGPWLLFSTVLNPANPRDTSVELDTATLWLNNSLRQLDITATGFQPKSTNTDLNGSGRTYLYLIIKET